MDRLQMLDTLCDARARWDALIAQGDPAGMIEPGLTGGLSVKDLIAHIAWFDREMLNLLRDRALAGSPLWDLPADERNAAIYAANRERPLPEILAEAESLFAALTDEILKLSDDDLLDPARFRDMPPDWVPWQVLAMNTCEHYDQHVPDLRAWLGRARGPGSSEGPGIDL